jgi:hypothetical protein
MTFGTGTTELKAYPEYGASFRLVDGVLFATPLLENGYPDMGDEVEVSFGEIDADAEADALKVGKELQAEAESVCDDAGRMRIGNTPDEENL